MPLAGRAQLDFVEQTLGEFTRRSSVIQPIALLEFW